MDTYQTPRHLKSLSLTQSFHETNSGCFPSSSKRPSTYSTDLRNSESPRSPLASPLSRSQSKNERIRYIKDDSEIEKEEATGKLREWSFPETIVVHPEKIDQHPKDLLIAIASRERRVLDLKAELAREENELESLKKQFHREASNSPRSLRPSLGRTDSLGSTIFESSRSTTDTQNSSSDIGKEIVAPAVPLAPGDCFSPISSDFNGDVNFLEAVEKLKIGGRWISGIIGMQLEDVKGQGDMKNFREIISSPRSTMSLEIEDSRRTSSSSYASSCPSPSVSMLSLAGSARRSHVTSPSDTETVSSFASEGREDGRDGYIGQFISSLRRNESVRGMMKRGKAIVDSIEDGIIRAMDVETPTGNQSPLPVAGK